LTTGATFQAHPRCVALRDRLYASRGWRHAYQHYEELIDQRLSDGGAVLDVGCGRTFPLARRLVTRSSAVFGIDPEVDVDVVPDGAKVHRAFADAIPLPDETCNLVVCRSVLEHLADPQPVFGEIARVLRPGGSFVFLTPSRYDYVSVAARLLPNRWHPWIVRRLEGRAELDTFPTHYRANSRGAVARLATAAGLRPALMRYLNHHPTYFMFSPLLYRLVAGYDHVISRWEWLAPLRGWLLGALEKPRM
jgi:SAM-dependent methyltransferase